MGPTHGSIGGYQWLTSYDHDIADLVRRCPDIVLQRRLAVTSFDSGSLRLTSGDITAEWWTSNDAKLYTCILPDGRDYRDGRLVAYSPRLDSIHGLPNEASGFNEWWVFDGELPVTDFEVFVNWSGFCLSDPRHKVFQDRFWRQITRLGAVSYSPKVML